MFLNKEEVIIKKYCIFKMVKCFHSTVGAPYELIHQKYDYNFKNVKVINSRSVDK